MTDKPISFFLVGCPRSGTTLLQRMLHAHSAVAVAPETFFIRRYYMRRDHYGDLDVRENLTRLAEDLVGSDAFSAMRLDPDAFMREILGRAGDYATLFRSLLDAYRRSCSAMLVGEKTPNHLLYVPLLRSLFPEARFVHVVRDPRAVVCSWRGVPWSNGSLEKDAEVWVRYAAAAREAEAAGVGDICTVRYEKLVTCPEETLSAVCGFLGIPYEPGMLVYHKIPLQAIDVEQEPWKAKVTEAIDANAVQRWSRELSTADIRRVENVTYVEMKKWGYAPCGRSSRLVRCYARMVLGRIRRTAEHISYLRKRWHTSA